MSIEKNISIKLEPVRGGWTAYATLDLTDRHGPMARWRKGMSIGGRKLAANRDLAKQTAMAAAVDFFTDFLKQKGLSA